MGSHNLARRAQAAGVCALVCGALVCGARVSPAHADVVFSPADFEEMRRRGPVSSCPAGSEGSPLPDVDCMPAAACTSDADCAEAGDCAPRSLCLAPERDGMRPVLGACLDGACPFGECNTERRCRGSRSSESRRAQAQAERLLLEALDGPPPPMLEPDSPAPTPMADPDTELPDPEPTPAREAPAPVASSGCGCRAAGHSGGSAWMILAIASVLSFRVCPRAARAR